MSGKLQFVADAQIRLGNMSDKLKFVGHSVGHRCFYRSDDAHASEFAQAVVSKCPVQRQGAR